MNIMILGHPLRRGLDMSQAYRGTYRSHPTFCRNHAEGDEVNRLFFWFLDEGGESGVVHDVARALRYAQLLNEQHDGERFEVVELVEPEAIEPEAPGRLLLGFDASLGFATSLLVTGLRSFAPVNRLAWEIVEIADLITRFYAPQLNAQGLFQTPEMAALCIKSMMALQRLHPNLYEGDDRFRAIAVFLVTDRPAEGR